jgi:chromate reductase, NAD(P)H dehydrogenase (quinone)
MYTIISGTNRIGSHTEKVAKEYQRILKNKNIKANIFTLKGLDPLHRSDEIIKAEAEILIPTQKFIFIMVLIPVF